MVAEDNIETYPKLNLAMLPDGNATVQLVVRFLEQNGILGIPMPPQQQIDNFHHKMHPLFLSSDKNNKQELVCDGCIGSIVDQYYYRCEHNECNYFLHVTCSQLPSELELDHPNHPHPLYINHPQYSCSVVKCSDCNLDTNGWWFECRENNCMFRLDIKCALLPKAIAHKSHRHPLSRIPGCNADCNGCGNSLSGKTSYGCKACGFFLGNNCAFLLPTAIHKWDHHLLSLNFLPFTDHPDGILCEVCEKIAHPKYWLYHCSDCDQSFHPYCIPCHGQSRNIKFGCTIQIANHSLKLVEKGNYKSQCGVCQKIPRLDMENALLCITCKLHVCRQCACDILEKKEMAKIATISESPCVKVTIPESPCRKSL